MKGWKLWGVMTLAAFVAIVGGAEARASHPTSLYYTGYSYRDADLIVSGYVDSDTPKCIADRTVKISFLYEGEATPVLVDVDRSSRKGAFSGEGPETHNGHAVTSFIFEAPKRVIKKNGHRTVCEAGTANTG